MNEFTRLLADRVERYIQLRRSLGHDYRKQARTLLAFSRFVENTGNSGPLTQKLVISFVLSRDVTPNVRAGCYGVVKNFADYFSVFDPRTEALDPRALPRVRTVPPVRILEDSELERLLVAAREIAPLHPMRGQTLYTVIGLLASTGLRSGEALRLDRDDVDLKHLKRRVLLIRQTKFRKDRLVPVHRTTVEVLRAYVSARDAAYPRSTSPAFFLSLRGKRLSANGFASAFRQACVKAGLDKGLPRGLRPHDLRHRFAVTRLVAWHQEGLD